MVGDSQRISGFFLSPKTGTVNDSEEERARRVDTWLNV